MRVMDKKLISLFTVSSFNLQAQLPLRKQSLDEIQYPDRHPGMLDFYRLTDIRNGA
jgi:hypothetical protein